MVDNFSVIISNAKENGKLILKNSGIKSLLKNNLQIPFNDIFFIDLSGNKFTGIPDVVTDFFCLQVLLCSHNMIRCLPANINNISYLETLDLSCNHLTSLHPSVCKLSCLKILIISSNRLMSLPTNIGRMSSLEELDASCNSITCLPEELSSLNRLRYLNLRHNKLLDLPTNLYKLELEVFDLSENQLTAIPCDYHRIDTLQTLNISGNPLNFPPANVCNKGLQHIMKYLQSEYKRQSKRLLSTQNSVDYSALNGGYKSDSLQFEINGTDSVTITSTASQHSRCDFDFDLELNEYNDCRVESYASTVDDQADTPFIDQNSGVVATALNEMSRDDIVCTLPSSINLDNFPKPPLSLTTIDETSKQDPSLAEVQLKKNRHVTSINSCRNISTESPRVYRSSRYITKPTATTGTKSRQSSVPPKERLAVVSNTSNQEVDLSSQCVVVIDNSNNESRKSSAHSVHNQANNSSANRFVKNVPASPLRVLRPKFADSDIVNLDRRNSVKSEPISPRAPASSTSDAHIKVNKFHKIIEAQLHVHINGKKLAEELSNGIYLCHLANILVPHSIPTVHTPSPGQQELGKQKSKRNLDNFLETCRRNGVPENCLFSARDVLNCNPVGLLHMAQSVDALIDSIRTKRSRPNTDHRTLSHRSADHIDWHGVLSNPHSLSQRPFIAGSSTRSSLSGYRTVGRPSKSTHRITTITSSKLPTTDDIVQYSSEV